ncbi:uncharacterized protein MONOS_4512 [Monocercomonoides exilis]|uniref:uncharacterized protein n=1 Tax=Monocercomonoides exilis TaxID=2049356 RepID=UPI00355A481E|nr:hypothetical protein MONOS_4512 [Monocercomonoides exilis]|eukprot:MONOS_4512.1-p1 / transcript=MONOS_4512.1 / gene=MONOS_4512 / organism=Monocercomonoides_exilis_PA203 / gene_product=unspecified product / transcript_product=unspecified product / location=Mono_scaffold00121:15900-19537(+) / protein_length=1169 / sequence_SO=supercontig / SO=protein_coding / is_pseudo=false
MEDRAQNKGRTSKHKAKMTFVKNAYYNLVQMISTLDSLCEAILNALPKNTPATLFEEIKTSLKQPLAMPDSPDSAPNFRKEETIEKMNQKYKNSVTVLESARRILLPIAKETGRSIGATSFVSVTAQYLTQTGQPPQQLTFQKILQQGPVVYVPQDANNSDSSSTSHLPNSLTSQGLASIQPSTAFINANQIKAPFSNQFSLQMPRRAAFLAPLPIAQQSAPFIQPPISSRQTTLSSSLLPPAQDTRTHISNPPFSLPSPSPFTTFSTTNTPPISPSSTSSSLNAHTPPQQPPTTPYLPINSPLLKPSHLNASLPSTLHPPSQSSPSQLSTPANGPTASSNAAQSNPNATSSSASSAASSPSSPSSQPTSSSSTAISSSSLPLSSTTTAQMKTSAGAVHPSNAEKERKTESSSSSQSAEKGNHVSNTTEQSIKEDSSSDWDDIFSDDTQASADNRDEKGITASSSATGEGGGEGANTSQQPSPTKNAHSKVSSSNRSGISSKSSIEQLVANIERERMKEKQTEERWIDKREKKRRDEQKRRLNRIKEGMKSGKRSAAVTPSTTPESALSEPVTKRPVPKMASSSVYRHQLRSHSHDTPSMSSSTSSSSSAAQSLSLPPAALSAANKDSKKRLSPQFKSEPSSLLYESQQSSYSHTRSHRHSNRDISVNSDNDMLNLSPEEDATRKRTRMPYKLSNRETFIHRHHQHHQHQRALPHSHQKRMRIEASPSLLADPPSFSFSDEEMSEDDEEADDDEDNAMNDVYSSSGSRSRSRSGSMSSIESVSVSGSGSESEIGSGSGGTDEVGVTDEEMEMKRRKRRRSREEQKDEEYDSNSVEEIIRQGEDGVEHIFSSLSSIDGSEDDAFTTERMEKGSPDVLRELDETALSADVSTSSTPHANLSRSSPFTLGNEHIADSIILTPSPSHAQQSSASYSLSDELITNAAGTQSSSHQHSHSPALITLSPSLTPSSASASFDSPSASPQMSSPLALDSSSSSSLSSSLSSSSSSSSSLSSSSSSSSSSSINSFTSSSSSVPLFNTAAFTFNPNTTSSSEDFYSSFFSSSYFSDNPSSFSSSSHPHSHDNDDSVLSSDTHLSPLHQPRDLSADQRTGENDSFALSSAPFTSYSSFTSSLFYPFSDAFPLSEESPVDAAFRNAKKRGWTFDDSGDINR